MTCAPTLLRASALAGTALLAAGCALSPMGMGSLMSSRNTSSGTVNPMYARPDMNAIRQKQQLMQDLTSNPDLPSWHDERQKLTMAQGDRVFDKPFDQVFDGMVVALATMGARVNNMDRRSGYITGSLPDLGPERTQALQQEAIAEYAQLKGYPPSVLQSQGPYDMVNVGMGQSMMQRMGGSGLTLTMVRQSAHQTKVKVRFDNVYYPRSELELYQLVWTAVDRQMFLDNSLDH
jgi:hypothetical protein